MKINNKTFCLVVSTTFYFSVTSFGLLSNCTRAYMPEDIKPINQSNDTITYQLHINPIITNNCISCHSGINHQGNLRLENYNQVRSATENGTLIQRINDSSNPMPPNGLMSISTRELFNKWVQNGYLDN